MTFNCLENVGQSKGTILQLEDSFYILCHLKAGLHMGQGLLWSTGSWGWEWSKFHTTSCGFEEFSSCASYSFLFPFPWVLNKESLQQNNKFTCVFFQHSSMWLTDAKSWASFIGLRKATKKLCADWQWDCICIRMDGIWESGSERLRLLWKSGAPSIPWWSCKQSEDSAHECRPVPHTGFEHQRITLGFWWQMATSKCTQSAKWQGSFYRDTALTDHKTSHAYLCVHPAAYCVHSFNIDIALTDEKTGLINPCVCLCCLLLFWTGAQGASLDTRRMATSFHTSCISNRGTFNSTTWLLDFTFLIGLFD